MATCAPPSAPSSLLSQVTGRAGRMGGASRALLQTYAPDHPVIRAIVSGDREAFYEKEIAERRAAGLPPFGRLAAIVVSGLERAEAQGYAAAFRRAAPARSGGQRARPGRGAAGRGARPPPLAAAGPGAAQRQHPGLYAQMAGGSAPPARVVRVQVDIDPQSFL